MRKLHGTSPRWSWKKRESEGWEEFHRRIENKIVEPSSKQGIQRSTLQQSPQILDPS